MDHTAQDRCPKCGRPRRPDGEACPRCGLMFERWNPAAAVSVAALDEAGEKLWQEVLGHWGDIERHEAFVKHCLQTNTLGPAGRRYRDRLDSNPGDAIASKMQAEILSKATLTLGIHQRTPAEPFTRSKWFWTVLLVAMTVGILFGLLWRKR